MSGSKTYTAFSDDRRLATGPLTEVEKAVRAAGLDPRRILVFDDETGELADLNTPQAWARALAAPCPPAPSAGPAEVMEIRLLARHLAWLEAQSGGPSAAIRRLVDAARRDGVGQARQAKEAGYRFISMLAGDFAGYEEACRALFAGDGAHFDDATATWPRDVRDHGRRLARAALTAGEGGQ